MALSSLVFLETREAQLLAAAWPYVEAEHTNEAWVRLSGVDESECDAESLCTALRKTSLCREDGTTDPVALKFIAQRMLRSVSIKTERKPKAANGN